MHRPHQFVNPVWFEPKTRGPISAALPAGLQVQVVCPGFEAGSFTGGVFGGPDRYGWTMEAAGPRSTAAMRGTGPALDDAEVPSAAAGDVVPGCHCAGGIPEDVSVLGYDDSQFPGSVICNCRPSARTPRCSPLQQSTAPWTG